MMRARILIVACCWLFCPPGMAQSRGELLYTTHCIACHTMQIHWRDDRLVGDWVTLKFQVRRWQGAASLGWTDGDILDVTRYLNGSIYHFEQTTDSITSLMQGSNTPASTQSQWLRLPSR